MKINYYALIKCFSINAHKSEIWTILSLNITKFKKNEFNIKDTTLVLKN